MERGGSWPDVLVSSAAWLVLRCLAASPRRRARRGRPATVTVRVEGDADTLAARTPPTTTTGPVNVRDGNSCPGDSAAAALEQRDRRRLGRHLERRLLRPRRVDDDQGRDAPLQRRRVLGLLPQRRRREPRHLRRRAAGRRQRPDARARRRRRLRRRSASCALDGVPATVAPGHAVHRHGRRGPRRFDGPPDYAAIADDAAAGGRDDRAAGGGDARRPAPTATATITLTARGPTALRATRKSATSARRPSPSASRPAATALCGTAVPPAGCTTTGDDGDCGTTDKRAPRGHRSVDRVRGSTSARGKGAAHADGHRRPRDPSGMQDVRLRLTRTDRRALRDVRRRAASARCKLKRCGAKRGKWFSIGDRERVVLPAALAPAAGPLRARHPGTVDKAGNVDTRC